MIKTIINFNKPLIDKYEKKFIGDVLKNKKFADGEYQNK